MRTVDRVVRLPAVYVKPTRCVVEVKCCAECGYLAVRKVDTLELIDADEGYRESGTITNSTAMPGKFIAAYWETPICFMRAANLRREITEAYGTGTNPILAAIRRDRTCEAATPWMQGFKPKELREMLLSKKSLRESREFQEKQANDARAFQATQAANSRRHNNRALTVAIVGVAVGAISTLIAAFKASKIEINVQPPPAASAPQQPAKVP